VLPNWQCDEIPCDTPCSLYNNVVSDVVSVAYRALCAELPEEACQGIYGYVTVGEPVHPLGNYIGGWVQGVTPYNPRNSQAAALQIIPRALVAVGVKLMETGWPTLGVPDPDSVPSFEAVNAMAMHSNSHAERITRALWNAVATRSIGDTSACQFEGMGGMSPVPPSGGLVGWTWAVQVATSF
jgi:hypothetical protein